MHILGLREETWAPGEISPGTRGPEGGFMWPVTGLTAAILDTLSPIIPGFPCCLEIVVALEIRIWDYKPVCR